MVRYKKLYKAKQEEDGVRREQTENILRLAKFKQSNEKVDNYVFIASFHQYNKYPNSIHQSLPNIIN